MLTRSKRSTGAIIGVVLALTALVGVACGDDDGDDGVASATATTEASATVTESPSGTVSPSDGGIELTVLMTDIAYDVETIEATAGEPVTIHLKNEGQLEHDFQIDEISVSDVSATGDGTNMSGDEGDVHLHLMPGAEGTITFTPDEAGEYTFYCTQAGHEDAGMVGTLIVS